MMWSYHSQPHAIIIHASLVIGWAKQPLKFMVDLRRSRFSEKVNSPKCDL